MRHKVLRGFIRRIAPGRAHILKNCEVVIDGRSFFRKTYKDSGCEAILGGEYDKYAHYLKTILKIFISSNVKCYVIFSGTVEKDIDKRKNMHQKVIDRANSVAPGEDVSMEPIFVKDVQKQVLDELGIIYYTTEYDSTAMFLKVSQRFNYPLITDNFEYSLLYTDCIPPKSFKYDEHLKGIDCELWSSEHTRQIFKVKHTMLPFFFALVDDESSYFKQLPEIMESNPRNKNVMGTALHWMRQRVDNLKKTLGRIANILTEEQFIDFHLTMEEVKGYFENPKDVNGAVRFFRNDLPDNSLTVNGKLAACYVNLLNQNIFSGTWLTFDEESDDAMLIVSDILFLVRKLFNKKDNTINFIGRKGIESCVWELKNDKEKAINNNKHKGDSFDLGYNLKEIIPGFAFDTMKLEPNECKMLLIALVYYCQRKKDLKLAYSMILSYVMLGPVTKKVGVIKRSAFMNLPEVENDQPDNNGLTHKDCIETVGKLMDMFYTGNKLKNIFDRKLLHVFSEFQHCLQHMNYLNKLCGSPVESTIYHKTVNITFAYNVYYELQDKECPKKYIERLLGINSVLHFYDNIVNLFEDCLNSVDTK